MERFTGTDAAIRKQLSDQRAFPAPVHSEKSNAVAGSDHQIGIPHRPARAKRERPRRQARQIVARTHRAVNGNPRFSEPRFFFCSSFEFCAGSLRPTLHLLRKRVSDRILPGQTDPVKPGAAVMILRRKRPPGQTFLLLGGGFTTGLGLALQLLISLFEVFIPALSGSFFPGFLFKNFLERSRPVPGDSITHKEKPGAERSQKIAIMTDHETHTVKPL